MDLYMFHHVSHLESIHIHMIHVISVIYQYIAGFSFITLAPIPLSFLNQTLAKPDP